MSLALAIGALVAVFVSLTHRHAGLILFLLLVWWVHDWLTSDPARERNQMELRQDEVSRVEQQKSLVTLADVQVVFEQYGDRLVRTTVANGSSVGISNLALRW